MSNPRIILRKESRNKKGELPLYVYFFRWKKKFRAPIGMNILEKNWDQRREKIRGRGKQVERENLFISDQLAKANAILIEYELRREPLSPARFKKLFLQGSDAADFLPFYLQEMERQYNRRLIGEATLEIERRTYIKMKEYLDRWPFHAIDRRLIESFDIWHQKRLTTAGHSGEGEREKALKKIRKYLNEAREAGHRFTDPFHRFKWPRLKPSVDHLSEEELKRLLEIYRRPGLLKSLMISYADKEELKPGTRAGYLSQKNIDRNRSYLRAFLIQCFSAARESDLKSWEYEKNIKGGELIFTPHKTRDTSGKVVALPITPVLKELLGEGAGPVVHLPANQKYNAALKRLAHLAGIREDISSKISRHTFGSLMVARGVSLVSLMELMGVTKIETVLIYAHSSKKQRRREILAAQRDFL